MRSSSQVPILHRLLVSQWSLGCALTVHVVLLIWGALVHSPSVDEVGHMAAGVSHFHYGKFDLYRVNPPLVRMVATLPVVLSQPETDWRSYSDVPAARPEFSCGQAFIEQNGSRSIWLFAIARMACIPFSLLGAWMCYLWGRDLYGEVAGRLACILWCFSPTIIGQAQMITPDTAATAAGLAAAYWFRQWLRWPNYRNASLAGAVLGLTLLTKSTWIILYALWPALWIAWHTMKSNRSQIDTAKATDKRSEVLQVAYLLVVATYVLNVGYLFERSFERLGDLKFISHTLTGETTVPVNGANRFSTTWCGAIPVPVPANYLLGIDVQKHDFERGFRSYLRGEWKHGGWWYYYLYAWFIKEPLAIWCLAFFALLAAFRRARLEIAGRLRGYGPSNAASVSIRDQLILYGPAVVVLVLVSSQTGFNHHLRYILPCVPALYIWLGSITCHWTILPSQPDGRNAAITPSTPKDFLSPLVVGGCLLWFVVSSLAYAPHQLSYFNELVGGPAAGGWHLENSNLDWGQDLPTLKRWYDAHPDARPFRMAYFGMMEPAILGIDYSLPPRIPSATGRPHDDNSIGDLPPGWYAVSESMLRGHFFAVPTGTGRFEFINDDAFTYFQRFQPVARAGYSILIYHISQEDADRVREDRIGLQPLK